MSRILLCRSKYRSRAGAVWQNVLVCLQSRFMTEWTVGIINLLPSFQIWCSRQLLLERFANEAVEITRKWFQRSRPLLNSRFWKVLGHASSRLSSAYQRTDMHFGLCDENLITEAEVHIRSIFQLSLCFTGLNVLEQPCVSRYVVLRSVRPYLPNFQLRTVFHCGTFCENQFLYWSANEGIPSPPLFLGIGQRWEFIDTAARWHSEPSSYACRARQDQVLDYPGLTKWVHLQFVIDLWEDVEFQDLQFEPSLDLGGWCYLKQSRQFFSQRPFCLVVPHLEIENLPQIGDRFFDGYYWNRLRVDEQQRFEVCVHAIVFCYCVRTTRVQPYIHTSPGTPCSKVVDECLWISDTAWNNDGVISKLEPWAFVWISVRTPDNNNNNSNDNNNNASFQSSCTSTSKTAIQSMGFKANKFSTRGIFYLETNEKPTHCRKWHHNNFVWCYIKFYLINHKFGNLTYSWTNVLQWQNQRLREFTSLQKNKFKEKKH